MTTVTNGRLSDFILTHLEPILRCAGDATGTAEQVLGAIAGNQHGSTAARRHADERLATGFTIDQLVAEYRALRSCVLRLWAAGERPRLDGDVDDIIAFNDALDQVLLEAVTHFSACARRQAETERGQLNALLEAAPVGIGMADREGRLTMINPANRNIWGDAPVSSNVDDYAVFKGWWADGSTRHGQPIAAHEWGLARALRGEAAPQDVVEIEPFDAPGTRRTILLHAAPVRDAAANVTGAVVAQMDITNQVRTEAALRESEAKFRTIADAMPQMVWSTLPDGFHDYYNSRWYEFTGSPPGANDGEGWNGMFHPDDRAMAWEVWRHSLATGEPYEVEYRLRHRSGQYRWVLGRALPVRGDDGAVIRWMGTCTDIHRHKQIEAELAAVHEASDRRRRLYETILDNSPDLAYVFDLNHRFTYANKVLLAMWGRTWEESIGRNCLELGYPDWHAEMHGREIEQVRATRQPIKGDVPFNGAFGRRIYEYIFVPVIGPDGEVEAVAGTTRDVTERKANEDALLEANRRKDEFLAMLAHELRNPLSPISAAAQALGVFKLDPERVRQASAIIHRQVQHMTGLIDDLLDVSRVTCGLITLERSLYDLKAIAYSAIEQVRPLIESHRHRLTVELCPDPAYIDGDEKRLVQIVSNLLNNAAKYTPPGGVIRLALTAGDDEVRLEVQDNGIGIAPELQVKVFDLFTQADRTADRSQGGLGIGLALVRNLVELQGGSVACASDGAGRGSRFTLRFPRVGVPASCALPSLDQAFEAGLADRRRILVVDDNVDAAAMLAMHLEFSGHQVAVEHDGPRALARAAAERFDVCILDIGLPGMDGNELARRLRMQDASRDAMLIAVTGYGQEQDRSRSAQAGFDRHLVKPVDLNDMLRLIAQPLRAADAAQAV